MSYPIISQLSGPKIDTDLIPRATQAGINAGNTQKTKAQAIADGIVEGVQTGQQIYQNYQQAGLNDQQSEINDQVIKQNEIKIENMPQDLEMDRQVRQNQLDTSKIKNEQATAEQAKQQKLHQRENELLTTIQQSQGNPEALKGVLLGGQYQDVFAKDPELLEQITNMAYAKGALDDGTAAKLKGQAMKAKTASYYEKEASEAIQKMDGARNKLSAYGELKALANTKETTIEAALNDVDFVDTSRYEVNGEGIVVAKKPSEGGADKEKNELDTMLAGGVSKDRTYYMKDSKTGTLLGTVGKEAFDDVQEYKQNKGIVDGSFQKADLARGYNKLGLDENGNPKQPEAPKVQGQGGTTAAKAPTANQPPPPPKVKRGVEKIEAINPEVPIIENPGMKEAVAEVAQLTPEQVEVNAIVVDNFTGAIYDDVKKEQRRFGVKRTFLGDVDAAIMGFQQGIESYAGYPSAEENYMNSVKKDFSLVMADARRDKIMKTSVGQDLYSEEAVQEYNQQVDDFYAGKAPLPSEVGLDYSTINYWLGTDFEPNLADQSSIDYARKSLSKKDMEGYTKATSPAHLYYLKNKQEIDDAVNSFEQQMKSKMTEVYRKPLDQIAVKSSEQREVLTDTKGSTIVSKRTSQVTEPEPTVQPMEGDMSVKKPSKLPVAELAPSDTAIEHIKKFEGLKLNTYDDGVGVDTIGYGHTRDGVKKGKISEEEAEELLKKDLTSVADDIKQYVKVPLKQNQYDALVSLVFNIGGPRFAESTLLKKLNAGDYEGAAEQFPRWRKGGGKVIKGLVRRRKAEQELFLA